MPKHLFLIIIFQTFFTFSNLFAQKTYEVTERFKYKDPQGRSVPDIYLLNVRIINPEGTRSSTGNEAGWYFWNASEREGAAHQILVEHERQFAGGTVSMHIIGEINPYTELKIPMLIRPAGKGSEEITVGCTGPTGWSACFVKTPLNRQESPKSFQPLTLRQIEDVFHDKENGIFYLTEKHRLASRLNVTRLYKSKHNHVWDLPFHVSRQDGVRHAFAITPPHLSTQWLVIEDGRSRTATITNSEGEVLANLGASIPHTPIMLREYGIRNIDIFTHVSPFLKICDLVGRGD